MPNVNLKLTFSVLISLSLDLNLSQNLFTGTLPTDLGDLTRLGMYLVALTYITGLPDYVFRKSDNHNFFLLGTLLLNDNLFTGTVPGDYVFLGQLSK